MDESEKNKKNKYIFVLLPMYLFVTFFLIFDGQSPIFITKKNEDRYLHGPLQFGIIRVNRNYKNEINICHTENHHTKSIYHLM